MTILACLDDDGGMLFHHRRQSRDRAVLDCLSAYAHAHTLWMSRYSAAMFEDTSLFHISDDYHTCMADGDACFVEDGTLPLERATELILYRWNRRYPAERHFPMDTLTSAWELISSRELVGTSHECITEEYYRRKG